MQREAVLNAAMATGMDITIRVVALEAIAGEPVNRWPRDRRGLALASLSLGAALDPKWVSERDTGIFRSLLSKARHGLNEEKAMEVVQDVLGGLSLQSHPRGAIGQIAGLVASEVLEGAGTDRFVAILLRHTGQRALDVIRKKDTGGGADGQELLNVGPGQSGDESAVDAPASTMFNRKTYNDQILDLLRSPKGQHLKDVLRKIWMTKGTPSERAIAIAHLDDPARPLQDIAVEFGVSASYVSRSLKRMIELAHQAMQKDRDVQKTIDTHVELEGLGYGGVTASAKRIATRHVFATMLQEWMQILNKTATPEDWDSNTDFARGWVEAFMKMSKTTPTEPIQAKRYHQGFAAGAATGTGDRDTKAKAALLVKYRKLLPSNHPHALK